MTAFNPHNKYCSDEEITTLITEACEQIHYLNQFFQKPVPSTYKWKWNNRLRTSGGRAKWSMKNGQMDIIIELNPHFWAMAPPKERWDTILHETAHCLCYTLYPRQKIGHGYEWRRMCEFIGLKNPSRTHGVNMAHKKRRTKKFDYYCDCSSHKVGARIHNKIQKGSVYRCNSCKSPIRKIKSPRTRVTRILN